MSDKQQPPDYMNYKKYKKNSVSSHNMITIFVTTFLIMLVFFTGLAKQLTPKVDVSIGDENGTEAKESGLGVKRFIDDRLKSIQMADGEFQAKKSTEEEKNQYAEDDENEYFSTELEEKVKIPKDKVQREEQITSRGVVPLTPPPPRPVEPFPYTSNPSLKVVVGNYSTIDQAKAAQAILQDAGLGVTPFIKNIGGAYTLQVGSFTSSAKAESLADELIQNNFPAKIVQD